MATTNYSWNLPTVGGSENTWGTSLNANWTALDTLLGGVSATEFAILDGATVTTAELNILDGVTATTAEINYLDGVTSNVQTQLDTKALKTTTITVGTAMTGGGDLSANRSIELNFATQAEAEAGTTSDKVMTPQRTNQAIQALVPDSIGDGQTWQIVSRSDGTAYQNTTGKPIMAMVQGNSAAGIDVSANGSSYVRASGGNNNNFICTHTVIVPNNHYYKYYNSSGSKAELR
jgi:hypothetical protein